MEKKARERQTVDPILGRLKMVGSSVRLFMMMKKKARSLSCVNMVGSLKLQSSMGEQETEEGDEAERGGSHCDW